MKAKDLLKLKTSIDEAKSTQARLEGQRQGLLDQLKTSFKCDTVEEAEQKLANMKKKNEMLNRQIEEGLEEIEKKYMNLTEKD